MANLKAVTRVGRVVTGICRVRALIEGIIGLGRLSSQHQYCHPRTRLALCRLGVVHLPLVYHIRRHRFVMLYSKLGVIVIGDSL